MKLIYYTSEGEISYESDKATVSQFAKLWEEFKATSSYGNYNFFIHGGFVSYLMSNPQWVVEDIDIFIARNRILDLEDLKIVHKTLLELGKKYKLRLDVKYFSEYDSPEELYYGTNIQFITSYRIVNAGNILHVLYKDYELMYNGLFKIKSSYEMDSKTLNRINKGKIMFRSIKLNNYEF